MYSALWHTINRHPLMQVHAASLFLVVYIDWMLMPLITKFEGLYLPIYMIGFFMLLSASDGFIQPLFKKIRQRYLYRFSAALDTVQLGCYALAFTSPELFTYAMLTLFTAQGITFEIARVHTTDYLTTWIEVKEYLMTRSLIISLATVTGTGFAMLFDLISGNLTVLIGIAAVLTLAAIVLQLRLATLFKRFSPQEGL